ncbi:Lrp/AsnC family transcriptional regulator [Kitasatospora sp. NPDC057198]|uniref:Lrp/AsnC family transcriptional regulator n=1 Tax=Kitasatospora sp. NPDC057198 TaxID=3346046 RepID=UPI003637621E
MPSQPPPRPRKVRAGSGPERIDPTDARLLVALCDHPRATTVALAEASGLSRNTVQVRLAALERTGAVGSFERCVDPAALGYPLAAFVTVRVAQRRLDEVARALAAVPEVVQAHGLSGDTDLLVQVVAVDAEDLYRVAGQILEIPGVERTSTSLVMRPLVPYRLAPLLRRAAD